MSLNQNPEQIARDQINKPLLQSGWGVKNKNQINFLIGEGQTIRGYRTGADPADYILFVGGKPGGAIEAKTEQNGRSFTGVEEQTAEYGDVKLKRAERLSKVFLQRDFAGKLIGEINSDALPMVDSISQNWLMAAKSNDKYQISP